MKMISFQLFILLMPNPMQELVRAVIIFLCLFARTIPSSNAVVFLFHNFLFFSAFEEVNTVGSLLSFSLSFLTAAMFVLIRRVNNSNVRREPTTVPPIDRFARVILWAAILFSYITALSFLFCDGYERNVRRGYKL